MPDNNYISTLVKFDKSGPVPLAIKLDNRRIDIDRITYRWVTHRGAYAVYHFSAVLSSKLPVKLTFDSGNLKWNIENLVET